MVSKACRDLSRHEIEKLSDDEVVQYLSLSRWGHKDKQVCPSCGELATHYPRRARRQWRCRSCSRDFSITSGTPFSHHRIALRTILSILYSYVVSAKGVSAAQLARETGHCWKTAWLITCKFRETLIKHRHTEHVSGIVQMDGGYFGGKRRDANVHARAYDRKTKDAIAAKLYGAPTTRSKRKKQFLPGGAANAKRRLKRRLIFVIREVDPVKGVGATKTIVSVARSENEEDALAMAERYIQQGTIVMTDESLAFSRFSQWFDHQTVNHSMEYVSVDGVNDNQAESYFSRLRRAEYGVYHRFTPMYLIDYAIEFAWREDSRRESMKTKFESLLHKVMRSGSSRFFGGYFQGNRRATECLNL